MVENLRKSGTIVRGGYINVAEQFGLSTKRGTDFSLYFFTSLILLGQGYRLTDGLANICPSLRRLFNVLLFFNFPRIALFWAA